MKTINHGKQALMLGFLALVLGALVPISSPAATVTFSYTENFTPVPPEGPAPYALAIFDDGGATGTITLTMSVAATVGTADITALYFNLNPALDPTLLSFTRTGGDGPSASDTVILTGIDAFRAGGDGFYDILFDFPPAPGGDTARFNAGEFLVYEISMPGLTAGSFNYAGLAGPGTGNPGPFLSVARFQQRGNFVGAVPVPTTVWLFASGLLGLIGIANRKRNRRT
jgi:hypothetical protein